MFPGSEGFQGGAHRRDLRQLATSLCKHAEGGYQIIGEVSSDVRRNRRILTEILNALWRRAQSGPVGWRGPGQWRHVHRPRTWFIHINGQLLDILAE